MQHYFIINPAAGKPKGKNSLIAAINSAAIAEDISYKVYETTAKGDATRFVTSKCEAITDEALRFYACGGDGTLNEVINAAVRFPNAEVAVVPVGTGNDFVKNFSNTKFFMNLKRQIRGSVVNIDLLKFNGKYCVNVMNIGLDCSVAEKMSQIKRSPLVPSKMAYIFALISAFFSKYGSRFRVALDDETTAEDEYLLAAFGKGSYYGGGFKSLPCAVADDGYIDVCIAKKISRPAFLKCVGKYKKGEHLDLPFITYKKCKKIHFECDEPIGVSVDGEIIKETNFDVEVIPCALRFSKPEGCELIAFSESETARSENETDYNYQEV
ncbi:MAG: diacylglycerol kinase family lipid kinase [Clostridia bacterium]|nr:diacylglycerol kinase family lipid kinase [Clostridia bacterium]